MTKIGRKGSEFSESTRRALRDRVNGICSNPNCRISTIGPSSEAGKIVNLGKACHICAAAPGGPRYDKRMDNSDRKKFSNGIWLCNKCAELIDKDPNSYSEQTLRLWKRETEKYIRDKLESGKNDELTTIALPALHGIKLLNGLPSIEPRLSYKIEIDSERGTNVTFIPKENFKFSMAAVDDLNSSFREKMNELFVYGKKASFRANEIKFSGTRIFDEIISQIPDGYLHLGNDGSPIKMRYTYFTKDGIKVPNHITGMIWKGTSGIYIEMPLIKDVFQLDMQVSVDKMEPCAQSHFNASSWIGKTIYALNGYNKLETVMNAFIYSNEFIIEAEVNGVWHRISDRMETSDPSFNSLRLRIDYINMSRTLSRMLNLDVHYDLCQPGDASLEEIKRAISAINNGIKIPKDKLKWPLILNGKITEEIPNNDEVVTLHSVENESNETFQLFGKIYQMPRRHFIFDGVKIQAQKEGKHNEIILTPEADDASIEIRYLEEV